MGTPFLNWLLDSTDIARFKRDGILVVKHLVNPDRARQLVEQYEPFFLGQFPTGISPEKWAPTNQRATTPKVRWAEKCGAPTRNSLSFLYNKNLLR